MANYTRLLDSSSSFDAMIRRFGIITVMNADVYEYDKTITDAKKSPEEYRTAIKAKQKLCHLDTLKVANVTQEGPSKTITGGQYANPLIKYGKTARLEMQDALGNIEAIDALCGGVSQYAAEATQGGWSAPSSQRTYNGLHFGADFSSPKTIIGESFFLDEKGNQVWVDIIFYQFLPDSLFNLTQDSEGDATVFDMNGDLLATTLKVPSRNGDGDNTIEHGLFYSVLPHTASN